MREVDHNHHHTDADHRSSSSFPSSAWFDSLNRQERFSQKIMKEDESAFLVYCSSPSSPKFPTDVQSVDGGSASWWSFCIMWLLLLLLLLLYSYFPPHHLLLILMCILSSFGSSFLILSWLKMDREGSSRSDLIGSAEEKKEMMMLMMMRPLFFSLLIVEGR